MPLQEGQSLSHYRLATKIGEGGMGVVWKALDTTLDREVAIKVLPDLFAADPERLARFEREAKLLASLSHPGIAVIHGLHQVEGIRFLAMEYLPGQDLSQRLAAGPIPVDEAIVVALQVAGALEAAHEAGIIHRDLKPANIHLGPDGKVKVLDFGLAKAFEPDPMSGSGSITPTLTTPATRAGVIMGTAAYMSPEQAKGRAVDRRADIWAFGCVLYEMLTGRRPFRGDGISEILAAVIMGSPDFEALPAAAPAAVRRLVRRCLDKDPRRRLRDIGDARVILEETLAGAGEEGAAAPPAAVAAKRGPGAPLIAAALAAAALLGASVPWLLRPAPAARPLHRFELATQGPYRSGISGSLIAISPDGARLAYGDQGKLYIRALDHLEPKLVATATEPLFLFWSPDSAWLGYGAGGKIWKVGAEGGESKVVVDKPGALTGGSGGTWGIDDRIVYTRGEESIHEVPATGGDVKTLLHTAAGENGDYHQPSALPDGSGILFVYHPTGKTPNTLCILEGGKRRDLMKNDDQSIYYPVYSSSGHILYRRSPTNAGIWAVPFSLSKHEITGEAFLVVPDGDVPSVSRDGTLAHAKGAIANALKLIWVDRGGRTLGAIGQPQEQYPFPSIAPDGRNVAIPATENDTKEIWVHDSERGTMTRLTFDSVQANIASWSPKGDRLVYIDGSNPPFRIMVKAADGGSAARQVAEGWGPAFSPDGRWILFAAQDPKTGWDLFYVDAEKGGAPTTLLKAEGTQFWPRVSPDGQYFAYVSDETGREEIYLKKFPGGEGKWQVSADGGIWPDWGRKGDTLYFAQGDSIMAAGVQLRPAVNLGRPRELFVRKHLNVILPFGWPPAFDVSPDEQRFVVCENAGEKSVSNGIVLVENWMAEFAAKK